MFRRWQKDAVDKYRTLESFNSFLARLAPLSGRIVLTACDPADLYAVQSVLHSKGRNPELQTNPDPGFYYFLADAVQAEEEDGGVALGDPVSAARTCTSPAASDAAVRREAVVPVSSKSGQLTTETLTKFFQMKAHLNIKHLLLAIVDDDGSVSLIRVFNYLQPPFEGPETLPPLEAEGGGVGGESDDD